MIKPTVGRVVWYYVHTMIKPQQPPFAAIIAYVHSDRCVNLAYFNENGIASSSTNVVLRQEDDERPEGAFCEWMPYQLGQAAKTEAILTEVFT